MFAKKKLEKFVLYYYSYSEIHPLREHARARVHTHKHICNYTHESHVTRCLKMVGPRGDLLSLWLTYSPDSRSVASPSLISSGRESPEETAERSSE